MPGRATAATLARLAPLLSSVRGLGIDGLVEKANGAFYVRRTAVLHFHEDAHGVYADVKVDGSWQRVRVGMGAGDRELLALLRGEYTP